MSVPDLMIKLHFLGTMTGHQQDCSDGQNQQGAGKSVP